MSGSSRDRRGRDLSLSRSANSRRVRDPRLFPVLLGLLTQFHPRPIPCTSQRHAGSPTRLPPVPAGTHKGQSRTAHTARSLPLGPLTLAGVTGRSFGGGSRLHRDARPGCPWCYRNTRPHPPCRTPTALSHRCHGDARPRNPRRHPTRPINPSGAARDDGSRSPGATGTPNAVHLPVRSARPRCQRDPLPPVPPARSPHPGAARTRVPARRRSGSCSCHGRSAGSAGLRPRHYFLLSTR